MMMTKLDDIFKRPYVWRPLIIALTIIVGITISHKIYWETTTETNPQKIWDGQTFTLIQDQGENRTIPG